MPDLHIHFINNYFSPRDYFQTHPYPLAFFGSDRPVVATIATPRPEEERADGMVAVQLKLGSRTMAAEKEFGSGIS